MKQEKILNRREFLTKISYTIGGSVFLSSLPWLSALNAQQFSGKDKIKLGLIGVGSRGTSLALHLLNIPEVEIVAVCDDYEPHVQEAAKLTGAKATFADYRKLLEIKEIQAVVIATPLNEHYQIAIDAMDAGKDVFCEKAMAKTYQESYDMAAKAIESKKLLLIGHQRMFDVKYLKGVEQIKNGKIGSISQIRAYWHRNNDWRRPVPSPELERKLNWRLYREYSCGLMTELASHQIQVANWILDDYPETVYGSGSIVYWNDGREVNDNVNLVYRYKNGVHLNYDSTISNKLYGLEEEIMGNLGTIELERGKYYPEELPPAPGILQLAGDIEKGIFGNVPIGGASWASEVNVKPKGENIISHKDEYSNTKAQMEAFVVGVRERLFYREHLQQAYNATIASLMGYQSILENKVISFPEKFKWIF